MPDIDPELWILVHGGIEPEAMLEWPLRAQWAWGAAILDMVAERANSIGWPTRWTGQVARQRLEGWRKEVERALTAEWPPDLVALKRAVKLLSEFLWDEIGSEDMSKLFLRVLRNDFVRAITGQQPIRLTDENSNDTKAPWWSVSILWDTMFDLPPGSVRLWGGDVMGALGTFRDRLARMLVRFHALEVDDA